MFFDGQMVNARASYVGGLVLNPWPSGKVNARVSCVGGLVLNPWPSGKRTCLVRRRSGVESMVKW